ncbi:MAG: helix-turn-helix domain-containing protein [Prevotellaceae bacterium]|jgi:ligand-binding sensor domain-containing protein/AraC-like DNA-binding protein|nr:helix-turn-helix domain-containing protein [Prevotellaceae bacterium]
MRFLPLLICYVLLSIPSLWAQEAPLFRTMTPEGGLCSDAIMGMEQDGNGYVWIVTEQHLYRFDGTEYKKYYTHFEHSDSLDYAFSDVTVDRQGRVLVSTNNGLFRYNHPTDTFVKIAAPVKQTSVDGMGNLWLHRNNAWLYVPREADLTADIDPLAQPQLCDGRTSVDLSWAFATAADTVYAFTFYNKIYQYTSDKKTFKSFLTLPDDKAYILEAQADRGKLWVLTLYAGLYKIDIASHTIEAQYKFFMENDPRTLRIDRHGQVWIGTIKGIYTMNPDTGAYHHYLHDTDNPNSLPNNSVWVIREDRRRNLWIGGYAGTLSYVNMDEEPNFDFISLEKRRLNYSIVSAFSVDRYSFWIGTDGGGLNRMNRKTGKFTYYTTQSVKHRLTGDIIKSIVTRGQHNEVWVGTYSGGLICLHLATGKTDYLLPGDRDDMLYNKDIRKILADGDRGLWVMYQITKPLISYYDYHTGRFTHYLLDPQTQSQTLVDMAYAPTGMLWVIGQKKLYAMDRATYRTKVIDRSDFDRMSFTACSIDSMGSVWLGTGKSGLVEYIPGSDMLEYHTFPEDLKGSTIGSLLIDDHACLWMGTDNGLLRYDPVVGTWNRYEKNVGTQGNVYLSGAAMKDKVGRLYFGGTNGFTMVDTNGVGIRTYNPPGYDLSVIAWSVCALLVVALLGGWMRMRRHRRKAAGTTSPEQAEVDAPQTEETPQIEETVQTTGTVQTKSDTDSIDSLSAADAQFLQTLTSVIESHIETSDLDVAVLAEEMSCSRTKLFRRVKALTGKNIVQYVLSCRMQKAARVLKENPTLTMREVMSTVGIESQSYFANAFKKEFGESPSIYVERLKREK